MSNKLKIVLTVSLVLNVLFAGLIIGFFSSDLMQYKKMRTDIHSSIDKLPAEKANLVKKTMKELHKETRKSRREIRKTRKNISEILSAPNFNELEYDAEIKKLQELQGELLATFGDVTKELAGKFDRDERKVLAELLQKRSFKHRSHHGHDGEGIDNPPPGLDQPPPF